MNLPWATQQLADRAGPQTPFSITHRAACLALPCPSAVFTPLPVSPGYPELCSKSISASYSLTFALGVSRGLFNSTSSASPGRRP